ncbi:MAG: hypothetical protein KHX03_01090 [Clostridium sp.]|nr:hypothetical protein [Clostridium sp.]
MPSVQFNNYVKFKNMFSKIGRKTNEIVEKFKKTCMTDKAIIQRKLPDGTTAVHIDELESRASIRPPYSSFTRLICVKPDTSYIIKNYTTSNAGPLKIVSREIGEYTQNNQLINRKAFNSFLENMNCKNEPDVCVIKAISNLI